jgi:hypothetical protein
MVEVFFLLGKGFEPLKEKSIIHSVLGYVLILAVKYLIGYIKGGA